VHGTGRRGFLAELGRELGWCEPRDGRDLKTARVAGNYYIDGVQGRATTLLQPLPNFLTYNFLTYNFLAYKGRSQLAGGEQPKS
jgi:hypothetical protein